METGGASEASGKPGDSLATAPLRGRRRESRWCWIIFGALGALVAFAGWWTLANWELVRFRYHAYRYRRTCDGVAIYEASHFFRENHKEFTEKRLRELLGPPKVVRMGDVQSDYASVAEWMQMLGVEPNGSEKVLWYSDTGPPDHFPSDESGNIYFLVRDGRVIDYGELFP